ncbi:MAG TPA: phasin family protein [Steroidobacteraceae bacterium]|jgi:poly(hydroxyalkanoate) granule-associated protein
MAAKKKGKLGASAAPKGGDNLLYSAHQIWLAGLGALSRAQAGAPKVFEDLMREGSKLQGGALDAAKSVVMQAFQGAQKTVNKRVDDVKEQATETWDNLEKIFQSRVQRAMHQLGMPTAEEITALARKVEELAASVEKLAAAKGGPRKRASHSRRRHAAG